MEVIAHLLGRNPSFFKKLRGTNGPLKKGDEASRNGELDPEDK